YDNDIQADSPYSYAPWQVTKRITSQNKDFDGAIIFVFQTQTPVKSKPLDRKSIIIERDGSILDNWIYDSVSHQIVVFDQEIDSLTTAEYILCFDFQQPEDVVINFAVDNLLAFFIMGLVMSIFSFPHWYKKKEKDRGWWEIGSLIITILGIIVMLVAVFLWVS
ncbi:MAG: hypothetical protein JSW41_00450, partial [Candidatus Aenigmatarchaeota archaeon]